MGFWDFFRKKSKEEEIEIEEIKLSELQSWMQTKKTEMKKQEKIFLDLIQARISQLIQELEEKISVLKQINVDEKKAEEKIKLIVKENLDNYIYYLEKLIADLRELDNLKEADNFIEKINSLFSDFEKRSKTSYEKATFLIGKELGSVKENIRTFFKNLEKILKENKDQIDQSKIILSTESKIKKFTEVKKTKSEIEKAIDEYNEKIGSLNNNIKIKKEEIEKIRKSEKFLAENRKKEAIVRKKEELEKEIDNLREILNFKSLANFFHSFEKEMTIIKAHKENFKQAFQKTKGEEIASLLQEAKLQTPETSNKLKDITEKEREINSIVIEETGIENIETTIKKIKSELEVLNSKQLAEGKKSGKLEVNLNELINSIKQELTKMNVNLS